MNRFTKSEIAWEVRYIDLCYIGTLTDKAMDYIAALRTGGFSVEAVSIPNYEDYQQLFYQSRGSLCIDVPVERYITSAAIGCLIFSENSPELAKLNIPGVIIIDSPEKAVEQAQYYFQRGMSDLDRMITQWVAEGHDEATLRAQYARTGILGTPMRPGELLRTEDALALIEQARQWYEEAYDD